MSDKNLLLSVVIPAYNSSTMIGACLDSVCHQDEYELNKDYEVIVVDDGSTDRTNQVVENYSVRLISFGENKGRIEARKAGAEAALSDRILFVDSRIRVSTDLLKSILEIGLNPCYSGVIGDEVDLKRTYIDRLFFELRRLYYGKYFELKDEVFALTKDNFNRVPKGTGCFFCDKDLFLRSIPKDRGKNISDDTKLMHHMVFTEDRPIYRCKKLRVRYEQRQEVPNIIPWFTQRGVLFTDHYINRGSKYFNLYIASLVSAVFLLFLLVFATPYGINLLLLCLAVYSLALLVLAKNFRDYFAFWPLLLMLVSCFWIGVTTGFLKKFVIKNKSS